MRILEKCHQGGYKTGKGGCGGMEQKLNGNHLRSISGLSRGQNELIGKLKMPVSDVISIRV